MPGSFAQVMVKKASSEIVMSERSLVMGLDLSTTV